MSDGSMDGAQRADNHLVGGDQELRALHGHQRPLDHPLALELFGEHAQSERARAAAFIARGTLELEIGFGRGAFLASLAEAQPDVRYLGFEVRTRWCLSLLRELDKRRLDNVRVIRGDVRAILPDLVEDGALRAVYLLFPDPWWKKRHQRRRVLAPPSLRLLGKKVAPGGSFWLKTDVPMNVEVAEEAFAEAGGFTQSSTDGAEDLPMTYREKRCHRLGLPLFVRRWVRTTEDLSTVLDAKLDEAGSIKLSG